MVCHSSCAIQKCKICIVEKFRGQRLLYDKEIIVY